MKFVAIDCQIATICYNPQDVVYDYDSLVTNERDQ